MRIGFDCLSYYAGYPGGLTTFTNGLLGGMINAARVRGYTVQLYAREDNRDDLAAFADAADVSLIALSNKSRWNFQGRVGTAVLGRARHLAYRRRRRERQRA